MKFSYNTSFTLPKQSQRSRYILLDGSRFFGLFWKEKPLPYKQRNTVLSPYQNLLSDDIKVSIEKTLAYFLLRLIPYIFGCKTEFLPSKTMSKI